MQCRPLAVPIGNGNADRSIHNIFPKVSTHSPKWKREDVIFFSGHVPFDEYLCRFNLTNTSNYSCGEIDSILHYVTECILTSSWRMRKPKPESQQACFKKVADTPLSRTKIHNIFRHIHVNSHLFNFLIGKPSIFLIHQFC
ncbi:hypothetical protein AVEN_174102-1 [Araneus ventricosus]|uniref:Uncharacterized protein n=1 Tax=Araneus ventricosus TaxID=182803 RepID=A0A4Y2C3H6_ARAVE|nr:hypothetical protein AVEN_174102-1 [Araneus ventricosus]